METTDDADEHKRLADHLVHEGWYDMAEEEYRKTIEINPGDAEAHCSLRILLKNLGRHDEAGEEFREALRMDPEKARKLLGGLPG